MEGRAWLHPDVTALPKIVSTAATSTSTVRLRSTTTSNAPTSKGNYTCRPGATGFFADASSCSLYHWCVIGVLQSTHRCTAGLHFSASANGCLWPKDAECKNRVRSRSTTSVCILNVGEGQIAPPYSPVECLAGRSGYFPDPYDCSVFHYCDGKETRWIFTRSVTLPLFSRRQRSERFVALLVRSCLEST